MWYHLFHLSHFILMLQIKEATFLLFCHVIVNVYWYKQTKNVHLYMINTSSSFLHSTLSLASEDADSPESLTRTSGSFSDGSRTRPFDNMHSPDKPPLTRRGHLQELHDKGAQSSPASLSGSLTDIPVLLVNGAPQPDLHIQQSPGPEIDLIQTILVSNSRPSSPHSEWHVL